MIICTILAKKQVCIRFNALLVALANSVVMTFHIYFASHIHPSILIRLVRGRVAGASHICFFISCVLCNHI